MSPLPPRTAPRIKDFLHEKLKGGVADPAAYDRSWEPRLARKPLLEQPISQACTAEQIYQPRYRLWTQEIAQPYLVHRKQWEWVYILQVLHTKGYFAEEKRGLGFGVGTEPIPAVAVKNGCKVTATDSAYEQAQEKGWTDTNQHAGGVEGLTYKDICDRDVLVANTEFRVVDMRDVPDDLVNYDFTWSACALEHLGTLQAGFDFILRSLDCLKPGGIAVHTTEYNVSSNTDTIESGDTVLYRRQDIERFAKHVKALGHHIDVTFGLGDWMDDRHIDEPPYSNTHLKVRFEGHVITSFGITIEKKR